MEDDEYGEGSEDDEYGEDGEGSEDVEDDEEGEETGKDDEDEDCDENSPHRGAYSHKCLHTIHLPTCYRSPGNITIKVV